MMISLNKAEKTEIKSPKISLEVYMGINKVLITTVSWRGEG